jgi:enterochelin esterase-like enzyme
LSMGCFTTLSVGLPNLDMFSHHFCYSAGWQDPGATNLLSIVPYTMDEINGMLNSPYYLGIGSSDFLLTGGQETADTLTNAGMNFHFELTSGAHEWMNWRRYLHQTLQVAFKNQSGCGS